MFICNSHNEILPHVFDDSARVQLGATCSVHIRYARLLHISALPAGMYAMNPMTNGDFKASTFVANWYYMYM